MTERILKLLDLSSESRAQSEIEMAVSWFQKKSKLFHDLPKEIAVEIIRQSQYEKKVTDDVIIRQGDKGDTFYILLSGKISIYIDNTLLINNEQENIAPLMVKQREDLLDLKDDSSNNEKLARKLDRYSLGNYIISQEEGYSFGEIALMSKDNTRNASIVADCACTLLVLHRDMYNQLLMEHQQHEFNERAKFIETNSLFKNWSPRFLRQLQMSLQKEFIEFGADIVQQGQNTDGIKFLISGTAEMVVEPHKYKNQFALLYPFAVEDKDELRWSKEGCLVSNDKNTSSKPIKMEHVRIRRAKGYTAAEQLHQNRHQSICLVRAGEVLGDIEMICGLQTHVASVRSIEKCQLYVLDARAIERLLSRHRCSMNELRHNVQLKLEIRSRTLTGEPLPFFKYLHHHLREEEMKLLKSRSVQLPALINSKFLPSDEQLWQHMLKMYIINRAPLIHTNQASFFYKDLMETSASQRAAIRVEMKKSEARTIRQLIHIASLNNTTQDELNNADGLQTSSQDEETLYKADRLRHLFIPQRSLKNESDSQNIVTSSETNSQTSDQVDRVEGSQIHPNHNENTQVLPKIQRLKQKSKFCDLETSEKSLHLLETRLHSFLNRLDRDFYQQEPKQAYLPKLKRYQLQKDGNSVPKQGGRVLVKKRVRFSKAFPNAQAQNRSTSLKSPRIYAHMVEDIHTIDQFKLV